MSDTLALTRLRGLDLAAPPGPGRPAYLSAASGLVWAGAHLYVVADDELHLGIFGAADARPGRLLTLFAGTLPDAPTERKARKPDLEALTLVPAFGAYPHGALLALGSGSTRARRRGVLLALDADASVHGEPRTCDLSGLFAVLDARFDTPNIEGAFVSGDELCLLQRGNRRVVQNAIVRFPLAAALAAIQSGTHVEPVAVHAFDLGKVGAIPLCFTDGAALPGGDFVFSAVAEDTPDAYRDGPCSGAAIGIATRDGVLRRLVRLDATHKIEGIAARVDDDAVRLLLVTDADDPAVPACLYSGALESGYTHGA
jgi:hypothetical protein